MSTVNDTDLLLVERGGVQYKIEAIDLNLSFGSIGAPVEVLTPVDGAGVGGALGPSPSEVEFTSQNSGTTPVSASDATLSSRKWTLETRASSSDPWSVVVEADDYSPVGSQNGSTPWANKPTLQANTQYRVKVEYNSANARSVESDYNTFTTGNS